MPSQTEKAVLTALGDELRARPWDSDPALYLMYIRRGRCHLEQIRTLDGTWGASPVETLLALAGSVGAWTAALHVTVKPGLHGAAFGSEAFEFLHADEGSPRFAELAAASADGSIEDRPDRIEIRSVVAVDRNIVTYNVKQARDGGAMRKATSRPGDGTEGHRGTVVNALDLMVRDLLGVPVPGRRPIARPGPGSP